MVNKSEDVVNGFLQQNQTENVIALLLILWHLLTVEFWLRRFHQLYELKLFLLRCQKNIFIK